MYRLFIALLFVLCAPFSSAQTTNTFDAYLVYKNYDFNVTGLGPHGACAAVFAITTWWPGPKTVEQTGPGQYACRGGDGSSAAVLSLNSYGCPSNSSLAGSTCTCSSGLVASGQSCVAPPNPCSALNGVTTGRSSWDVVMGAMSASQMASMVGTTRTYSDTIGGNLCQASGKITMCGSMGGETICSFGPSSYTGQPGIPDATELNPASDTSSCPTGQCPGTVNGAQVCARCATTTSSSSSTKQVQTSDPANPGQTSNSTETTNRVTTCTGAGSCSTTTTVTTTAPNGAVSTQQSTEEQPQEDFCQKNPTDKACKAASWGGSCSSGFLCEGDAVQCAMARVQHQIYCSSQTPTGEASAYDAAKLLSGNQTTNLPGNETINIGPTSFQTADLLGGGSCVPDYTFVYQGQTVTVPFSDFCQWLAILGNILVAVSFLLSIRIISGVTWRH